MTPEIKAKYLEWLKVEAEKVGADGCTGVEEFYHPCCLEHDLAYRYRKDPRAAFLIGWDSCAPINRSFADAQFKQCIQLASPFKKWSPMSYWRYFAVRLTGWFAWRNRGESEG